MTRISAHPRKGTKGVREHSRSSPSKKRVPNSPKKRRSYKITRMSKNEIEDRLHSLFIWSNNSFPIIPDASKIYDELGIDLPYQGITRIGTVNRYAGLNTYYLNPDHKYNREETVKFLKANMNEKRPMFNKLGRDIVIYQEYSINNYERGDQLIDEYSALYSEKDKIKWVKANLR